MEFFGKVYYTMDKQHPDWDHVIEKIQLIKRNFERKI